MKQQIEVVRIIARLNIGGPALQAIDLSLGLGERYRTLLVTGEVDTGEADLIDRAEAAGVDVMRLPELGRRLRPWQDLVALFKLVKLLRAVKPRIVHTHTAKAGSLGRIAALLAGVPVRIHTFHGHVFHGYFGPRTTELFLRIERLLARLSTRIVTVSTSQAAELVGRYRICPPEKMQVIPLGFDLDRFAPARSGALREGFREEIGAVTDPVITIVGRLAPIKNHGLFLRMARRLTDQGRRCRFVVVGGGTEEAELRRLTAELGLEESVDFLGWRHDLDRIYAGSDVVVLTSTNEGTPVCLIEALAAGRPVVATGVGGVADVLEHGRLGVVVPPNDEEALAAEVGRLLDQPEERSRLGSAGAAASPARFGRERLLRDVRSLYDEVTRRRGRSAADLQQQTAT